MVPESSPSAEQRAALASPAGNLKEADRIGPYVDSGSSARLVLLFLSSAGLIRGMLLTLTW